jgi:hypothetical protein
MNTILMRSFLLGSILTCLLATHHGLAQSPVDNVVIVLDASGSMKQHMPGSTQTKMAAAKDALIEVLGNIPQSTHVGLLVFSAANVNDDWVIPLGPRDDQTLMSVIQSIEPHRGTPLGEYIKVGADRLLEERASRFGYGTYRLLIVTDGEANDPDLVEDYTPLVLARGLRVDVIGVAMSRDHTLANKVHTYRRANDAASLKQAIAEVFAEVGGGKETVAQEDAFELLAPIPMQMAAAAIDALSNSGNQPIAGENASTSTLTHQPAAPGSSQTQGQKASKGKAGSPFSLLFLIVAVLAVLVFAKFLK